MLPTARLQRWPPKEVPRTLLTAEIAACGQTSQRLLKGPRFRQVSRLGTITVSSARPPSLRWIRYAALPSCCVTASVICVPR